MAGRNVQPVNALSGLQSHLHMRPPLPGPPRGVQETRLLQVPTPRDIDLHDQQHLNHDDDTDQSEIDLHPPTATLVTNQAWYMTPPDLPGPNVAAQGDPPPPGLTLLELGFNARKTLTLKDL